MINLIAVGIISVYTTLIGTIVLFTNDSLDNISREMRMEIHTFIR